MVFNQSDFEFLLSKGSGNGSTLPPDSRDSLLIRFDPLTKETGTVNFPLPITKEEPDQSEDGAYALPETDERYSLNDTLPLPDLYNNNSGDSADEAPVVTGAAPALLHPKKSPPLELKSRISPPSNHNTVQVSALPGCGLINTQNNYEFLFSGK